MKKFAIVAVLAALSATACAKGDNAYYYCVDDASGKQICQKKSEMKYNKAAPVKAKKHKAKK